jgi:thymidylate kinase
MLITFSGLDGAGKSTLIEWLRTRLEAQGHRVAVFHMNDHVGLYAYLRAVRDRAVPDRAVSDRAVPDRVARPAATGPRARVKPVLRRVRNAVVWNKPLRRWIYLLDLGVFFCYRLILEQARDRVLIMDRYFYDTLVDVSDGRHWFWVRLLERLTPTPTVPVFLDIGPEESFRRKGEYSVEYLRRRYQAYQQVFEWVPSVVHVVNDDFDVSRAALWRGIAQRVPFCSPAAGGLEPSLDDRNP